MTRTRMDNSADSVHQYITVVDLALFVIVGYEKKRQAPSHECVKGKAKTKN